MSGAAQKYYITTAIPYVNGAPHIGHAYEAIATDTIARFERLDGKNVRYLAGSDEHGLKMLQTAAKEGLPVAELAARNTRRFKEMLVALNCSNDDYIATTEERHKISCQELWLRMEAAGDIYLGTYAGWYSVRDEAFYQEAETELDGHGKRVAIISRTPVEWTEDKSYFFKLSAYAGKLLALFDADPNFVLPVERKNEIVSFLKGGLTDLSVSRTTFDWGVPVPGAPGHVMYVWVDALTNYLSATGFPNASAEYAHFWPADLHMIGKDITRFHSVYWPAFLLSAGLPVPKRIFSHGFLYSRGEKMSKSVGNVVDPFDLVKAFGVDQVRYFFLREVPFGQDGNYSTEAIINRTNADLANDLGNLAQRSLSMVAKNCDAKVPEPGDFTPADKTILAAADALYAQARDAFDTQAITKALDAIFAVVADANRYFAGEEPWAKRKTDFKRMETILYTTAEVIRQVAILTQPVMPTSSAKLLDLLAISSDARSFASLGAAHRLNPGTLLPTPSGVFPRYMAEDNLDAKA